MKNPVLERMKQDVAKGRLSRREFIQYSSALGIGLGAASSLWSSTVSAIAKKGGSLKVGMREGGSLDTMDPTGYLTSSDYDKGWLVYSPLVAIDRNLQAIPALATSWEPNALGDNWRFELRKGVTFSNGRDFTSADVIYSLKRHQAPDSESPGKALLAQVINMKADGKHAVHFQLAGPNAELPMLLTQPQFMITQEGIDDFSDAPASAIGTGGYILTDFELSVGASFKRNPNTWKEGNLDNIELLSVLDTTARMNALISGEMDIVNDIDYKVLSLIQKNPSIKVVAHETSAHYLLAMMVDRAPTDNKDLRTAIKYLIPRQQIVDNVFKGYAMVANDTQVAPTDPNYCRDIPQRPYDVDKAKFHLKKAGINKVQVFTSTAPGASANDMCLLLREAAAPAGLDVEVVVSPADSYWGAVWMAKPICVSGWNPRPTADLMLSVASLSDAPWNETQWKSDPFDQLVVLARGELDKAKRYELYCEAQRILHDDGGVGMLGFYNYIDASNDTVGGFEPHPAGFMRNAFMMYEVWAT